VTIFVFPRDQSELLESGKRSENMGNLALTSVSWKSLDVDSFCSVLGHFNSKIRSELGHGVRSLLYCNFLRIEG